MQKYTKVYVIKKVQDDTNGEYSVLQVDEQGTSRTKRQIVVKHNVPDCGYVYATDLYEFVTEGKRRCPKCKGKRLRKHFALSYNDVTKWIKENAPEYTLLEDTYVNGKTKMRFRHETCKKEFLKTFEKFKAGQRCPHCIRKKRESFTSIYFGKILDDLQIEYIPEKRFEDCINSNTGQMLPFDYYIPAINTLIEIDGAHHIRPSFGRNNHIQQQKRDKIKNEYCKNNGITLIRIREKEWNNIHKIAYDIVKKVKPNVTLEDINNIKAEKNIVEAINRELQKARNGEYVFLDKCYIGSEREHKFLHRVCNTEFTSTLYTVKSSRNPLPPCPKCSKIAIKTRSFIRSNIIMRKNTNNRYKLSSQNIYADNDDNKKIVICAKCYNIWEANVSNINQSNGGCPRCLQNKIDKQWLKMFKTSYNIISEKKRIETKIYNWIFHNIKQYCDNKLKGFRRRFFLRYILLNQIHAILDPTLQYLHNYNIIKKHLEYFVKTKTSKYTIRLYALLIDRFEQGVNTIYFSIEEFVSIIGYPQTYDIGAIVQDLKRSASIIKEKTDIVFDFDIPNIRKHTTRYIYFTIAKA